MDANDSKNTYHRCCKPEIGRGCAFCDSETGTEPEAILSDGCFKLHETPWLEAFPDNFPTDIFEVRFKNTRRSFYQNVNNLPLKRGDIVAVEASPGHDIGIISLTGDMVAKQMRRTGFNPFNGEFKKIYRKAKPYDIERWQEAIALEHETMIASRQIAAEMGLNMKIGDVEYQGDKIKAIFYYIADERVDFRELIKVFAERFHIRIEMKQIGARQEAGRIGGLGACGRELCCASWISSFSSVTTGAARMQDLSLNPQKLAGQCSKLKCCLMYEYDVYAEARREFPRLREPLQTLDGEYFLVKSDILAGTMTFSTSKDAMANIVTLPVARVKEIIALNRAGQKVERLLDVETQPVASEEPGFRAEEDSITRFDQTKKRSKNRRNRNKNGNGRAEASEQGQPQQPTPGTPGEPSEGSDRKSRKPNANRAQQAPAAAASNDTNSDTGESRTPGGEGRAARNNATRRSRNNNGPAGKASNNARSSRESTETGSEQTHSIEASTAGSSAATSPSPRNDNGEGRDRRSNRNNRRRNNDETGNDTPREPRGEARRSGDKRAARTGNAAATQEGAPSSRDNQTDRETPHETSTAREARSQQPRSNRPPRNPAEQRGENRPRREGGTQENSQRENGRTPHSTEPKSSNRNAASSLNTSEAAAPQAKPGE